MVDRAAAEAEAKTNYAYFRGVLPELLTDHRGDVALLRGRRIVSIFPSALEALRYADTAFPDSRYSLQPIVEEAAEESYFSNAVTILLL